MYEYIECMCGDPSCVITVFKENGVSDSIRSSYTIIYPMHYEDHILYTNKWHCITKYFRWVKRFFCYLYKILRNDLHLVYDVNPSFEDLKKLQKLDSSITVENFGTNEFEYYAINNFVKVNSYEVPLFVLLNFLFKGYLAADYVKCVDRNGVPIDKYSCMVFKIF